MEVERRVRAAGGLRLVCDSSMVWPYILHTNASVRRMPWHTHIMAQLTWVQTAGETVRTARSTRGDTETRAGPNGEIGGLLSPT